MCIEIATMLQNTTVQVNGVVYSRADLVVAYSVTFGDESDNDCIVFGSSECELLSH